MMFCILKGTQTMEMVFSKLVEMTFDGRLTLIWIGVATLVAAAIYELKPWFVAHRAKRARRIYLMKHYPTCYKSLK
jgi:hypothetical protein